jgi:Uma2 family endonuclease
MSTITIQPAPDLTPPYPVKRFTVDEYHKLIDLGMFADDDRFELLEGWIIPKMTRNPPHDVALDLTRELLGRVLPEGWRLRVQSAITTLESEPEPDFAIARGEARDYLEHHPGPADISLVVEVSDSSLDEDRSLKARIYARAGIPNYWIVNVVDGCVEVRTGPSGPGDSPSYGTIVVVGPEGELPLVLDGREVARIAARDVLP